MTEMYNSAHPGAVIKEAIGNIPMTVSAFAAHIGVSRLALSRVLDERAGTTAEMSIRNSQAFGQPSPDIWFKMQNNHDFWQASQVKRKLVAPLFGQFPNLGGGMA